MTQTSQVANRKRKTSQPTVPTRTQGSPSVPITRTLSEPLSEPTTTVRDRSSSMEGGKTSFEDLNAAPEALKQAFETLWSLYSLIGARRFETIDPNGRDPSNLDEIQRLSRQGVLPARIAVDSWIVLRTEVLGWITQNHPEVFDEFRLYFTNAVGAILRGILPQSSRRSSQEKPKRLWRHRI